MTAAPHVSEVCSLPAARGGRESWPGGRVPAAEREASGAPATPAGIPPAGAAQGRRAAAGRGAGPGSSPSPSATRLGGTRMSTGPRGGSWRRRFRREAQARARPRACYVSRPARARAASGPCSPVPPRAAPSAGNGRGAYISVCVGSACWGSAAPEVPSDLDDFVTRAEGSLLPGAVGTRE